MPVQYFIDTGQGCIFMHVSGVIDDWELGTAVQRLWHDQAFDPKYSRLIDGSEISEMRTGSNLLQAIAEDVRSNEPRKIALVAKSEQVRSVFELYKASLTGVSSSLFTNLETAIRWLGVELPRPWPPEPHLDG
jgi:hypothetical protein